MVNFKLYENQETVANNAWSKLMSQKVQYITGEVGSGKTYVGTELIKRMIEFIKNSYIYTIEANKLTEHNSRIFENQMAYLKIYLNQDELGSVHFKTLDENIVKCYVNKDKVKEFEQHLSNYKSNKYLPKQLKWTKHEPKTKPKVNVIVPKEVFNKWKEVLELANIDMSYVEVYNKYPTTLDSSDLVLIDEIHLAKTKIGRVIADADFLIGLTGTAINKKPDEFKYLTNTIAKYFEYVMNFKDCQALMVANCRHLYTSLLDFDIYDYLDSYVAVFLCNAMVNLAKTNKEYEVFTHKISLKMDEEERAFYKFLNKRLSALDATKNTKISILNEFLDRDRKTSYITKGGELYYVGDLLHSADSKKQDKLVEILKEHNVKNENILVYVFSDDLAKVIANKTENLTYINTSINENKHNAEKLINEELKHSNVIINICNTLHGLDLKSNVIVFYQTPDSLMVDIQATGRILRDSSEPVDKNIYYIYHDNTVQSDIIATIEKNRKLNNKITIGVEDEKTLENKDEQPRTIFGFEIVE